MTCDEREFLCSDCCSAKGLAFRAQTCAQGFSCSLIRSPGKDRIESGPRIPGPQPDTRRWRRCPATPDVVTPAMITHSDMQAPSNRPLHNGHDA
jgi:hypothetical protein